MQNGIWVFCENAPEGIRGVSYELLGEAARLARGANLSVTAVALGANRPVEEICARGADDVLLVEDEALNEPEEMRYTQEICALAQKYGPEILLLGGTMFGRSLAPRIAARLKNRPYRRLYAPGNQPGDGLARTDAPGLRRQPAGYHPLSGRAAADGHRTPARVPHAGGKRRPLRARCAQRSGFAIFAGAPSGPARRRNGDKSRRLRCIGLRGSGIGGAENIARAEKLAQKLGGALAATRPMVDAGILPYARQVGQTGKAVAPKLYLALGVSGAIQHLAGVNAEVLAAVQYRPRRAHF